MIISINTIFITGSSGFIGRAFVRQLLSCLDKDSEVFLLSRNSLIDSQVARDKRVTALLGDLIELDKFADQIKSCQYVFHLAANAVYGNDADYDADNYSPTRTIIDILKSSNKIRNFIFTSTIGAVDRRRGDDLSCSLDVNSIPNPCSLYGKSKLKAENYIKSSGVPYTIIRPTWVYGPGMRANSHINKFISMAHEKSFVFRFNFPGKVSIIHVSDLVAALIGCIDNETVIGKTYFAETESRSIGYILKLIYALVNNRNVIQFPIPRFRLLFKHVHHFVPLSINNLFVDYLFARDPSFIVDFKLTKITGLSDGLTEVVSQNNYVAGYWVITGANNGIGYALAHKLNEQGKRLILVDKCTNRISDWDNQVVIETDLSDEQNLVRLGERLRQYNIFRLINNAGIGFKGDFLAMDSLKVQSMIYVNIMAPLLLSNFALENIIRNDGTIVNISSSSAFSPLPGMSVYAATKSFIQNWSTSIWFELKGKCRILTFAPAGTDTNFQLVSGVSKKSKELLNPDDVAVQILKAIECKRVFVFMGLKNRVAVFVTKFLPVKMNVIFWGKMFNKMR